MLRFSFFLGGFKFDFRFLYLRFVLGSEFTIYSGVLGFREDDSGILPAPRSGSPNTGRALAIPNGSWTLMRSSAQRDMGVSEN